MFILCADKNKLTVRRREPLTSGSVNVNMVQFEFSPDWDGLERTAVFRTGAEKRSMLLGPDDQCAIPWEVLSSHGQRISAGVYGARGGDVVLPTIWADLGAVLEGAVPGENTLPPTPEIYAQIMEELQDIRNTVSAGGTKDHPELSHRDADDQHPISAITGLRDRLEHTVTTDNMLSVSEILKIMEVQ